MYLEIRARTVNTADQDHQDLRAKRANLVYKVPLVFAEF